MMYKGILDRGFPVTGAANVPRGGIGATDVPVGQGPEGLSHLKDKLLRSFANEDVCGSCGVEDVCGSCEAEQFLQRHANLGGAKIVAVLRSTPGQVYSPQELICLSRGEYPTPGQLHALDLDPIPLADTRALAAYLKRRNQLRARIAAGNNNPDLAWELDFLEKELKRIGKPGGGIKNSRPERDKAYHNLMTQLWRLFRAAHKEDPRLCAWLKTRIKTGRLFAWVETT